LGRMEQGREREGGDLGQNQSRATPGLKGANEKTEKRRSLKADGAQKS